MIAISSRLAPEVIKNTLQKQTEINEIKICIVHVLQYVCSHTRQQFFLNKSKHPKTPNNKNDDDEMYSPHFSLDLSSASVFDSFLL